ncbi:MAG: hypothetical protein AAF908_05535 [Pseudomonadota bacterium]
MTAILADIDTTAITLALLGGVAGRPLGGAGFNGWEAALTGDLTPVQRGRALPRRVCWDDRGRRLYRSGASIR